MTKIFSGKLKIRRKNIIMDEITEKLKNKKDRLIYIDLLKFIAIFFVILYHGILFHYNFFIENKSTNYLKYFILTILSTGVPLFLFANGYLLFGKEFDLKKHVRKIVKFIIITVIWGIITLICLQIVRGKYFSIKEFFDALWTWRQDWLNHLWYMGALVCIYVFFPILKQVYDTNKKIFIYFTLITATLTFGNAFINDVINIFYYVLTNKIFSTYDFNFFNMFNPYRGILGYTFVYFCVGGLAYYFKEKIEELSIKKRNIISIICMLLSSFYLWILGLFYSKASGMVWDVVWNGYDTIFTFCNVICIFVLSLNWKHDKKYISVVSRNTLGIYFIHLLIIWSTKPWLINFGFLCNIPMNLVYAIIVLLISTNLSMILRKIPIISKLVG